VKSESIFRRRLCSLVLANVREEVEKDLKKDLPCTSGCAFTSDHWLSRANDDYQSLTVHYIDKNFVLKQFLVNCMNFVERKTSEAIAEATDLMIEVIPGWSPSINSYMVTDGASNMKKAMRDSRTVRKNLICLDHIINR